MKIDDILGRLKKVHQSGRGSWSASCPAHDDSGPSLGISVGRNGNILLHCFAGCPIESVVTALGLEMKDLMGGGNYGITEKRNDGKGGMAEKRHDVGNDRKTEKRDDGKALKPVYLDGLKPGDIWNLKGGRAAFVEWYDYRDETGAVLYRVLRFHYTEKTGKTFVQVSPHGDGRGWVYGVSSQGCRKVLYRLPEVLAAAKNRGQIFVVEGEKDVAAAERLGLVATCCVGGAGKGKWQEDYSEAFKGASYVYIIADKDDGPVKGKLECWQGQRHASDVLEDCKRLGINANALTLPDRDGWKVKDLADFVAAGGTKSDLIEVVASAPPWCPDDYRQPPPIDCGDGLGVIARPSVGKTAASSAGADAPASGGGDVPLPPPFNKSIAVDFRKRTCEIPIDRCEGVLKSAVSYALGFFGRDSEGGDNKLSSEEYRFIVSQVCIRWLKWRGAFFYNSEEKNFGRSMYFDNVEKKLLMIESDEFHSWISTNSGINRNIAMFGYLMADVHNEALQGSDSKGVVPSVLFDRREDVIYISNGDSEMARIDRNGVSMVDNGTDGVLFVKGYSLEKWRLIDGRGDDPFTSCSMFKTITCESKHGIMLIRLWVMGLFAKLNSKPPILFTGLFQSGKTRTAQGICEMIGAKYRLTNLKMQNGDTDFWVQINQGGLVCFDNVDSRIQWFNDAIQSASTSGSREYRELYKSNTLGTYYAKSYIMLTSNRPYFATESGLSDRLIIVRLDKSRTTSDSDAITSDFKKQRDSSLTWISRTLSVALADDGDVVKGLNIRHPDFSYWCQRVGRSLGCYDETLAALKSAEGDKSLFVLQNDLCAKGIIEGLVKIGGNFDGTATELSESILSGYDLPDDDLRKMFGVKVLGKVLSKYKDEFKVVCGMSSRILTGRTVYSFNLGKVGMVDLNSGFAKSTQEEERTEFMPNAPFNPPNPPLEEKEGSSSNYEYGDEWEVIP